MEFGEGALLVQSVRTSLAGDCAFKKKRERPLLLKKDPRPEHYFFFAGFFFVAFFFAAFFLVAMRVSLVVVNRFKFKAGMGNGQDIFEMEGAPLTRASSRILLRETRHPTTHAPKLPIYGFP